MIDVTTMDPIVFANTYHAVEKLALENGAYLHYNDKSEYPFEIRCWNSNGLMTEFKSILQAKNWFDAN